MIAVVVLNTCERYKYCLALEIVWRRKLFGAEIVLKHNILFGVLEIYKTQGRLCSSALDANSLDARYILWRAKYV